MQYEKMEKAICDSTMNEISKLPMVTNSICNINFCTNRGFCQGEGHTWGAIDIDFEDPGIPGLPFCI